MKLLESREFDPQSGSNKGIYRINNIKNFKPINIFSEDILEEVFDFAYGMSFGEQGQHRNHRTGGNARRGNGEIFSDTFQGKLAEFALYDILQNNDINVDRPDMAMFGEGQWDTSDFNYKGKKIAVKSTKSFGQLMLLESEDWNENGLYIPNLGTGDEYYDYFALVRIDPFTAALLQNNRFYYTPNVPKQELKQVIMSYKFFYDIPGCMTRNTLMWLIQNKYFIPQGSYINRIEEKNKLDADNYYIQTGDLHDIKIMIINLQKL